MNACNRMRRAWAMFRIDKEWKEQMLEQSRGLLPEGAIAGQGLTVPADLSRPRRTKEAGRKIMIIPSARGRASVTAIVSTQCNTSRKIGLLGFAARCNLNMVLLSEKVYV